MTNTTDDTEVSRRQVLRTGALASGGVLLGGTALTGTAAGSPRNNFGYVVDSTLVEETVTLSGPPKRKKVFCDAGGSESRIKTEAWAVVEYDDPLYLIPSGYEDGDTVAVGDVFTFCTRNEDIKGEVSVTKQ